MDQELVAYFDRRFSEFKQELKQELRQELREELGQEFRTELGGLRDDFGGFKQDLREEIARTAAETRLHFDTVAERLMDKIQLVGEGVIGVDQKLDRFRGEVADDFHKLDRRLLRLEARPIG